MGGYGHGEELCRGRSWGDCYDVLWGCSDVTGEVMMAGKLCGVIMGRFVYYTLWWGVVKGKIMGDICGGSGEAVMGGDAGRLGCGGEKDGCCRG